MKFTKELSLIIYDIKDTVDFLRIQDFFHGQICFKRVINKINALLMSYDKIIPDQYIINISQYLKDILNTQENEDYILMADLLEVQMLPCIEEILQITIINDSNSIFENYLESNLKLLNDNKLAEIISQNSKSFHKYNIYSVEAANTGVYTLKYSNENASFYYHSNYDPVSEGNKLAAYYSKADSYKYVIFGFGFGYHVLSMLEYDRRFEISVIENNIDVLTLAFLYCDLSKILLNKRFHLIWCDTGSLDKALSVNNDHILLIHYPSLAALEAGRLKDLLKNYFINTSSMMCQKKYLDWNFYYNMKLNDRPIDNIKSLLQGKTAIYIGGGPSLEYSLNYLQNSDNIKDKIIICASTVYRNLIANNIIPDFVIMIDGQDTMINHIKDIPWTKASLIYMCTASSMAVHAFAGTRYICFQKGYNDAEKYALQNSFTLFETGGSVSTTAIDILIRFGCRTIITFGLDLAYTDGKHHSFTSASINSNNRLIAVKGVDQNTVYTTNVLNIYRMWIEKRIENVRDISFINVSKGAYIKGMRNVNDTMYIDHSN